MSLGLSAARRRRGDMPIAEKLWYVSWALVFIIFLVASVGFLMLYSAAGGNLSPWADRQIFRFGIGLCFLFVCALIDVRHFMRYAYIAYAVSLALLIGVELKGEVGMGAQRWIDLGFFRLQPSELMKIAMILTLARYFHGADFDEVRSVSFLFVPILLVTVPVLLVLRQPDLGTALLLVMGTGALLFMAGVRIWIFAFAGFSALAFIPVAWSMLREYQKNRVLTFLNPSNDPLGTGYHITQSKIALGSGGVFGKGYMQGTQSHLNFLPEHQTDFIFTMLGEEIGMIGGIGLLALYGLIIAYGYAIALRCRHQFGRLVAMGVICNFFLYVFINITMVMGLIPVVGVPLPLVSYGGTAMITLMIGFGILMSAYVHRDVHIGRGGVFDDG